LYCTALIFRTDTPAYNHSFTGSVKRVTQDFDIDKWNRASLL